MPHLKDGTLHALLDRELAADELQTVERHLAECAECAGRVESARGLAQEAERLLAELEPPPLAGMEAYGPALPLPAPGDVASADPEPVILIPPEPEKPLPRDPRRRAHRRGWALMAASVALVAGVGGVFALRGGGDDEIERPIPTVAMDAPLSPQEIAAESARPPRAEAAQPAPEASAPAGDARADAGAATPPVAAESEPASAEADDAAEAAADAAAGAAADTPAPAAQLAAKAADAEPPARTGAAGSEERRPSVEEARRATRRVAASQATDRLTRQQRLEQQARERERQREIAEAEAARATAASAAAAAPAPPAPAAPVDATSIYARRAQVHTTLSLAEARDILGSPRHSIDGMRPMVTGLTDPENSPGAMGDRRVVRVVYLDPGERLITLDQQRWPAERAAGRREPEFSSTGGRRNAQWVVNGVWLSLTATGMSNEEFRALVRRVR